MVNKGQRSRGTAAPTLCEMCSLRHPIRTLLLTYPIIHRTGTADCFKCSGLGCYYFSSSCKKGELVYKSLLSHLEHNVVLPTSLPWSPTPSPAALPAGLPGLNNCLEIPFNSTGNCLLPRCCLNSYKSLAWRGRGRWEASRLLIQNDIETAVLFNYTPLKKHTALASLVFQWLC